MSTKWNNSQKLQKTPKVCKKGPADLPENLRRFRYYPLQAYASWFDPFGSGKHDISGFTQLSAFPSTHQHIGWIRGDQDSLELILNWTPITQTFDYHVKLYSGDILEKTRVIEFSEPVPALPWMAGLFVWHDHVTTEHVESKIYS